LHSLWTAYSRIKTLGLQNNKFPYNRLSQSDSLLVTLRLTPHIFELKMSYSLRSKAKTGEQNSSSTLDAGSSAARSTVRPPSAITMRSFRDVIAARTSPRLPTGEKEPSGTPGANQRQVHGKIFTKSLVARFRLTRRIFQNARPCDRRICISRRPGGNCGPAASIRPMYPGDSERKNGGAT
jgi:hypothetical protein